MKIPLLDLSRQHAPLTSELNQAMLKVAASTQYIMGPEVKAFESEIAQYLGCKYAISCGNGTDALVLSLRALGIGPGDEVITTPFTFFATAEAISSVGAVPVFVDVLPDTYNMDVAQVEAKITTKTKAIMPVHIFGQPVDMDPLLELAAQYKLKVIEDACQAIGAEYKGRKVGTLGDVACFSFFPTKNLGGFGDGGMIVTNDEGIAKIIKGLRVHGSGQAGLEALRAQQATNDSASVDLTSLDETSAKYYNFMIGYNSRLDELQAAILRVKLPFLQQWNKERERLARIYNEQLVGTSILTPAQTEYVKHIYHLYVVQTERRTELVSYLQQHGVSTGVYYPVPLHLQKVYQSLGYKSGDLPVSEYLSARTLALPLYPGMTEDEQQHIVSCIHQFDRGN